MRNAKEREMDQILTLEQPWASTKYQNRVYNECQQHGDQLTTGKNRLATGPQPTNHWK